MNANEPPAYRALRAIGADDEDAPERERPEAVSPPPKPDSAESDPLDAPARKRPASLLEAEADIGRETPLLAPDKQGPVSARRGRVRLMLAVGVVLAGGLAIASHLTDGFGTSIRGGDEIIDLPDVVIDPALADPSVPGSGSGAGVDARLSLADAEGIVMNAADLVTRALPNFGGKTPTAGEIVALLTEMFPITARAAALYGNDELGVLYVSVTPLKKTVDLRLPVGDGEASKTVELP